MSTLDVSINFRGSNFATGLQGTFARTYVRGCARALLLNVARVDQQFHDLVLDEGSLGEPFFTPQC